MWENASDFLSPVSASVHEHTGAWYVEVEPIVHCPEALWVVKLAAAHTMAQFRKTEAPAWKGTVSPCSST